MVEWKKLGDVCRDIIVPMRDRPKVFDGNIPWCRIEDIEGMYFNRSLSGLMVSEKVISEMNLKVYPPGTVICSCSATLGVCAINTQSLITNQTFIGLVCSEQIQNRFLYYYMLTRKKELLSLSTTGTIPYVSKEKFAKMSIPIPSPIEQTRIVRILDTFTSSIDNLKQQIAERRKQYDYYLDKLFDLDENDKFEKKKLKDLLEFEQPTRYLVKTTEYDNAFKTPVLTAGQSLLLGYTDETEGIYYANKNNPTIIFDDFTTSFHWIDFDFKVKSSAMKMLRPFKGINFKYVFYAMKNIHFVPGSHQRHWISIFSHFEINYPPSEYQSEIVSILDTFIYSIQNLEAQLKLREKQYEYYRNKLLTFE